MSLKFDSAYYPNPSRRMVTFAKNGMTATSQPLAAQAGIEVMQKGGNAIDAAIAAAACLTVVEPTSNGIGGDAFALVWSKGKLYGLNASGYAPKNISIDTMLQLGYKEIPKHGVLPVTVPGVPSAWNVLSKRFGQLSLKESLKRAIKYAEEGFPVSPTVAANWKTAKKEYQKYVDDSSFIPWFDTFTKGGKTPEAGELWQLKHHAETLRLIANSNAEAFYRGPLSQAIGDFFQKHGGFLTASDLNEYEPEWVEPINICYRGFNIWEIPPNGQGLVALMALNILKQFDFSSSSPVDATHLQIEATKLAFSDGFKFITDPSFMTFPISQLLSEEYAKKRATLISDTAILPEAGKPFGGGTVYLATADVYGNMVSYIQSNYKGFGSGIVIPNTGIALQNRGWEFSMTPSDANALKGGKKTYHTIIPGFITKANQPIGPFGVMGGYMQPQGHLQVAMNLIDYSMNPQAALDSPRWLWFKGKEVKIEPGFPNHVAQALARKGHEIAATLDATGFGRGQIIIKDPESGMLAGGTDPRSDCHIAAY
ncbi:MAG: gamma-glutamyltransferase family protein [Aminivibrio sp.]|jgi:gamma-glutamyltranspeptidase/glutathione hydrolase